MIRMRVCWRVSHRCFVHTAMEIPGEIPENVHGNFLLFAFGWMMLVRDTNLREVRPSHLSIITLFDVEYSDGGVLPETLWE
jgi:hypothetical protein